MKKRANQDAQMDTTDLFILSKIRKTPFQNIVIELATKRVNLNEQKLIFKIKKQISKGYPLAYILERIEFLSREFYLNKNVLIPRPETEEWVDVFVKKFKLNQVNSVDRKYNIIDMATGSGVIGLSVWLELGLYLDQVFLVDISHEALEVANINYNYFKQNYTSSSKIFLRKSDLFDNLTSAELSIFQDQNNHNILLTNLPYLPDLDKLNLPDLTHEPSIALFSGQEGLDHFSKMLDQLIKLNLKFESIYFELDPRNIFEAQEKISQLEYFASYKTRILIDFMGKSRVLFLDIM